MEEIRKAFNYPKLNCQVVDSNTKIEELPIKYIIFDDICEIGGKLVTFTDIDHPITFCDRFGMWNSLVINRSYYLEHKDQMDSIIRDIVSRISSDTLTVTETPLISDELIRGISANQNIEDVSLGSSKDTYLLTEPVYQLLKNGTITVIDTQGVDISLENNFDPIIRYNQKKILVGSSSYERLVHESFLFGIEKNLSEDELENLKYLNPEASIDISFGKCTQIVEIIKRFQQLGQNREYTIEIKDKNEFNTYLFQNASFFSNASNITISSMEGDFALETYLKYEKRLVDIVRPAIKYSPFEKYLYAYNIVKQFKEYKENNENVESARQLYELLDNEYMVCTGYSNLLGDLLDKLGIPNIYYDVAVETGLENIAADAEVLPDYYDEEKKEEVQIGSSGHARRKVYIVDYKYGIDGYYIVDPTWDNDLQNDLYNFCLMTNDEYLTINVKTFLDIWTHEELYFSHSLEELYQKLNFLLDRNPDKKVSDYIEKFIVDLKKLDPMFYNELVAKYPDLATENYKGMAKETMQDILFEIGNRIVSKTDNTVSGKTIMECVKFLYDNAYGMSPKDANEKLQETIRMNRERQEEIFVGEYIVDENTDVKKVNKFDIEEVSGFKL